MAVCGCLVGDFDTVVRDCGRPRAIIEGIAEKRHKFAGAAAFLTMVLVSAGAAVKAEVRVNRD